jgi:uncharacterized protein YjbJ (UPF0337 family)
MGFEPIDGSGPSHESAPMSFDIRLPGGGQCDECMEDPPRTCRTLLRSAACAGNEILTWKFQIRIAITIRASHGTQEPLRRFCIIGQSGLRRCKMVDKDRIEGSAEQAKGKVKEWTGKAVGDKKIENEGKADQIKGKVQNAVGGLKDAMRGK